MRRILVAMLTLVITSSAVGQYTLPRFTNPGPDPRSRARERWHRVPADVLFLEIYRVEKAPLSDVDARSVDAYRGAIGKTNDPAERRDIEDKLRKLLDRIDSRGDWWVIGDAVPVSGGEPNLSWAKSAGRDRVLRVRSKYRKVVSELAPGDFISTAKPYFGEHYPDEYVCRFPIKRMSRPRWWPWESSDSSVPTAKGRVAHPVFDDGWRAEYEYSEFAGTQRRDVADVIETAMPAVFTILISSGSFGSGFIINETGIAITNAHVVDTMREFEAILHDGKRVQGIVLGVSEDDDLALVSLDGDGYEFLRLGRKREIRIGDAVLTIGTPEDTQLGQTVSKGIISGIRQLDGHSRIQTDAPLNQGNSGGPLLSVDGAVIGVAVSKVANSDNNEGLAFAIPITIALQSLPLSPRDSAP